MCSAGNGALLKAVSTSETYSARFLDVNERCACDIERVVVGTVQEDGKIIALERGYLYAFSYTYCGNRAFSRIQEASLKLFSSDRSVLIGPFTVDGVHHRKQLHASCQSRAKILPSLYSCYGKV